MSRAGVAASANVAQQNIVANNIWRVVVKRLINTAFSLEIQRLFCRKLHH
jgi:hypothetical protein